MQKLCKTYIYRYYWSILFIGILILLSIIRVSLYSNILMIKTKQKNMKPTKNKMCAQINIYIIIYIYISNYKTSRRVTRPSQSCIPSSTSTLAMRWESSLYHIYLYIPMYYNYIYLDSLWILFFIFAVSSQSKPSQNTSWYSCPPCRSSTSKQSCPQWRSTAQGGGHICPRPSLIKGETLQGT